MTIFIVLGAIGLGLLLVSLVFGDLLDIDGGLISIPGIAVALVVFGASGALTSSFGLDQVWAYVVAIVIGLVAYIFAGRLIRSLARSSDGTPRDVAGDTGVATAPISAASGEVSLDGVGEIERRLAFSDTPIPAGARIRVVAMHGTRVKVEPLAAASGDNDN